MPTVLNFAAECQTRRYTQVVATPQLYVLERRAAKRTSVIGG